MSHWKESVYARCPVAVQNWLLTLYGQTLRRQRFDDGYRRLRAEFERLERAPWETQEAYQSERLRRLVRHCVERVPYYRDIFQDRHLHPEDVRTPADLVKLPILRKEELRSHFSELLAEGSDMRRLRLAHTSGSTGSPLSCYWDREVDRATNAVLWQHRSWAGFEFGQPYATLLGRMIVPPGQRRPPFWRYNREWNQLFLSAFHLDESTAPAYLQALQSFQPHALEAYPSTAYLLACYLRSRSEFCPLGMVFTSAETLLPLQREVIEERFRCRVYDYLGATERVLFGGECGAGSGMHIFAGYGITEVTDDEGRPRKRGEFGHLTLTGLHNLAMPLLRYRIGDVSAVLSESCACGRNLPLMHPVTTKAEDIVVTPEGRFISSSVLTHPFKPMAHIAASQILQDRADSLLIRIVRQPGYSDEDTTILLAEFRKRVGPTMKLDIEFVETIPLGPGGKLRWIISKVPLRFGSQTLENLSTAWGDRRQARNGGKV